MDGALIGILACVVDDVLDHLAEFHRVDPGPRPRGIDDQVEAHLFLLGGGGELAYDVPGQLHDIRALEVVLHLTLLKSAQVQEIVYQPHQLISRKLDVVRGLDGSCRELPEGSVSE